MSGAAVSEVAVADGPAAPDPDPQVDISADFWGANQQAKALEKIHELAQKLQEALRYGPAEAEAGRNFDHVLGGPYEGWQVVTDVKVSVRRV